MSTIKEILKERILNEKVENIFTEEIFSNIICSQINKSSIKNIVLNKKHYMSIFEDIFKDLELNKLVDLSQLVNQKLISQESNNKLEFKEMMAVFNKTAVKYIILKKIEDIDNLFKENKISEAYAYAYNEKYYTKLSMYIISLIIKTNNFEIHFKQDIYLNALNKNINRDLIYLYSEIGIKEILTLYKDYKYLIYLGENREIGCDIEEKDFLMLTEDKKEEIIKQVGFDICLSLWFTLDIQLIEKYIDKYINEKTLKILRPEEIENFLIDYEDSGLFILTKIYLSNIGFFWYIMSLIKNENYKFKIIEKVKTKAILDNF